MFGVRRVGKGSFPIGNVAGPRMMVFVLPVWIVRWKVGAEMIPTSILGTPLALLVARGVARL